MRPLLVVVVVGLLRGAGSAQQPAAFEVASVKPVAPFAAGAGAPRPSLKVSATRFEVRNYGLLSLLMWAYDPAPGAFAYPGWLPSATERVDIQATIPAGATKADVQGMLRTLLAERMGLKTHIEPRRIAAMDPTQVLVIDSINRTPTEN